MPKGLHHDALVIDGLVYHCDGDVTDLKAGGIDALNITICHFEADFPQACAEIARWHGMLNRPDSPWLQVETAADLERARTTAKVGIIMGLQNIRPVADELDRFHFFRRLGLRVMQLTYNFRNAFGDGCLEPEEAGLTLLGRHAVKIMNDIGIAIDLSHVGQRTMLGAIEASSQPVLVTHANARALANLERNKTDDIIKAVAQNGGLIGASIYGPMCWDQNPAQKAHDRRLHPSSRIHRRTSQATSTSRSAPISPPAPAIRTWPSSAPTGAAGKASTASTGPSERTSRRAISPTATSTRTSRK